MKEKKEDHGKELLPPILLLLFTYVRTIHKCTSTKYKEQRDEDPNKKPPFDGLTYFTACPAPVSASIQAYFQLATHQPEAPVRPAGFSNKHVLYNTY